MNVRKSDGSLEEFDPSKIAHGVEQAFMSVREEYQQGLVDSLVTEMVTYDGMKTSEVRRQVEEWLMDVNKKAAREYISHFEDDKHLIDRDDFIRQYIAASNASTGSKYDSNANVANKNIATLNAEIPKQKNIKFNRYNTCNKIAKLFSKKLAKQYIKDLESHIIYKNDESSFGLNSPYCCALQSYPFLINGLKGIGGLSSAPKNIDSFCGMFVNWVFASASQFAGACAFAGFFNMFNYFACKEWGEDYFDHDDRVTRYKYENGEEKPITISKQIEQYFQQIVYSINQPAASRGFQSA